MNFARSACVCLTAAVVASSLSSSCAQSKQGAMGKGEPDHNPVHPPVVDASPHSQDQTTDSNPVVDVPEGPDTSAINEGSGQQSDAGRTETPTPGEPPAAAEAQVIVLVEAEATTLAGPHASAIEQPFAGVGLYANDDAISFDITFPAIPGVYRVDVAGASSSSAAGQVELLLQDKSQAILEFSGTELVLQTANVTLQQGADQSQVITLRAIGDDGSWDLFIDSVEVSYLGPPAARPPTPSPEAVPVATSGAYRNLFLELGKTPAEVDQRVQEVVTQLFYGNDDERLYYETGADEAYFYTADTDDVRSEGMSYGMMISLQLDKQVEFDRLWKFAKTRMQHQSGDRQGYFAWKVRVDGTHMDANPASDGEEYFAMALLMAAKRWGSGEGIYDYEAEGNLILDHMVNHRTLIGLPEWSGIANMIDPEHKQIVFSTEGQSATFTDPSYHLPHFYELFARWAHQDNDLWLEVAERSRLLFRQACHESTGLAPDYCEFDGTPTGGTHAQFRFDAWRVAMNIALDSYWWNVDPWQRDTWVNNYLGFFSQQGVSSHRNQFNIDGTGAEGDHSPGLVAMNAVAALISSEDVAWDFVEELWRVKPTTGTYRYYDGCLYLFGLLNVTGRFQIYGD